MVPMARENIALGPVFYGKGQPGGAERIQIFPVIRFHY